MMTTGFRSLGEVEKANKAAGKFWFQPETMAFFNSVIESRLIAGRFFITSERMDYEDPKRYTVHVALDNGDIEDVGEFRQFATLQLALHYAKRCTEERPETRFDPYDVEGALFDTNPDHFNWRPYIASLPIGVRTTRDKADEITEQLS